MLFMEQFNGIIGGIALVAAGFWMLKWMGESGTKSWIISTIAWSLLLYGLQNILFVFIGNPFKGLMP